ncbi:rhodanese-like domain-containing protein [Pseudomonadota bacterium]|nr:rhodanese-like domain-containing protein [Pseudomonadota bacterium]
MKQMSATELRDFLAENKGAIKIDVREMIELENGVLQDAIHIPVRTIPGQLGMLEKHKNDPIVLICRSGMRSDQAGNYLEQNGFINVINLVGGMNAWAKDIDSSMTIY